MINDSIDILDAKVVNLGVRFSALASNNENKTDTFSRVQQRLNDYFSMKLDIGESFSITDLYSIINSTPGIIDATFVKVFQKTGVGYASTNFNVKSYMSSDGRMITAPKNVIFEVRYPNVDIEGTIR